MLRLRVVPTEKEEIRMDQTPVSKVWALIPLYKLAATGDFIMWQVTFNGLDKLEFNDGTFIAVTPERALPEARRHYKRKYGEGYQPAGPSTPPLIKAMKGYDYTQGSIKSWPVWTQPKLDGMRLLCQDMGGGTIAIRSGLNNPQLHLTHMEAELRAFIQYLPRYCVLDMEAYTLAMNISALTSALRTIKTVHPRLCQIQCHIFDVIYDDSEGAPYEKRYNLLANAYTKYLEDRAYEGESGSTILHIVPCQVAANHQEVLAHHAQYVSSGYEGAMIKKVSNGARDDTVVFTESLYKQGRCNHILKYKSFKDEEAIIMDVTENGATVIFEVQDARGHQFPLRMRSNVHPEVHAVRGKKITYRYHELAPSGMPVMPVGIAIRDYE
jgi:hypothetical protein